MTTRSSVQIADATDADATAIQAIYADEVLHRAATFEEEPPSTDEMIRRMRAVVAHGYPYLVARQGNRVVGYSYASAYRARPAYRFSIENSVYIAPDCQRQGVGRALLGELIERCENGPWQQMVAVIGDSANHGSIALHTAMGFEMVGTLQRVGFKHNRWVDTVLMQRALER